MNRVFRDALRVGISNAAAYRLPDPTSAGRGRTGFQRGFMAGSSLEYKDFREYQPGDDLRHLDWHAYARADRLVLKRYHEEVIPHVDLVLDVSKSMSLEDSQKYETLVGLAAFFATAAGNAGYTHQLWLAGESCRPFARGNQPPSIWPDFATDDVQSPHAALSSRATFRDRGLRIFLSDLMFEGDPRPVTGALARDGADLLVIQILAERDQNMNPGGKLRLIDSETGAIHELLVDPATRRRYKKRLADHQASWREAVQHCHGLFAPIIAERFLDQWRFDAALYDRFIVRG